MGKSKRGGRLDIHLSLTLLSSAFLYRRSQPPWQSSMERTVAVCTTATQAISVAAWARTTALHLPVRASLRFPSLGGDREGVTLGVLRRGKRRDAGHRSDVAIGGEARRLRGQEILVGILGLEGVRREGITASDGAAAPEAGVLLARDGDLEVQIAQNMRAR